MHVEGESVQPRGQEGKRRLEIVVDGGDDLRLPGAAITPDGDLDDGRLLRVGHVEGTLPVGDPVGADRESKLEASVARQQRVPDEQLRGPIRRDAPDTPVSEGSVVKRERLCDVQVAPLVEGQRVREDDRFGAGDPLRALPVPIDPVHPVVGKPAGHIHVPGGINRQADGARCFEVVEE